MAKNDRSQSRSTASIPATDIAELKLELVGDRIQVPDKVDFPTTVEEPTQGSEGSPE